MPQMRHKKVITVKKLISQNFPEQIQNSLASKTNFEPNINSNNSLENTSKPITLLLRPNSSLKLLKMQTLQKLFILQYLTTNDGKIILQKEMPYLMSHL